MKKNFILWALTLLFLTACLELGGENYAPVVEISTIEPIPKNGLHRVRSDETLYSIAWRYGLDYRDLAQKNNIAPPYAIYTGQILHLKGPFSTKKSGPPPKPVTQGIKPTIRVEKESRTFVHYWLPPAKGPVIGSFSATNKGINIAGHLGDPVYATASGKVVYSGHGLRGYGNLIIIKHSSMYLTAYAHNAVINVKDGQWVQAGEKIAEMGQTGTTRVMLHFEIRKNGQPVNPLLYIHGKLND